MELFNQQQSIARLKERVVQEVQQAFPYENKGYRIEVKDVHVEEPSLTHEDQERAFLTDDSLEGAVRATIEVYFNDKLIKTHKNSVIVRVPFPNERGTFIVGGNDIVLLNRMQMRNGVYVHPIKNVKKKQMVTAEVRAGFQRFKVNFDTTKGEMLLEGLSMEFERNGGKVNLVNFLRFLGVSDAQIRAAIGNEDIANTILNNTPTLSKRRIYASFFSDAYPGDDQAAQKVKDFLENRLAFSDDSQKINRQTIGTPAATFDTTAILSTIGQLVKEFKDPGSSEDPDDVRFKLIKAPEDTIAEFVQRGIRDWKYKRLSSITRTEPSANKVINAKPDQYVAKSLNKLYRSDLAEHVDSANPLDLHQKLFAVTSIGTGSLSDRSASNENRNLQDTAFGKIDPVETPQSSRMGLSQHFANNAVIKNGRIYSKFFRVKNGKVDTSKVIDDIDPLDEYDEYIAFHSPDKLQLGQNGKPIAFKEDMVRVRHKGDFIRVPKEKVTLIDHSSTSHLSHATALIPFGAHNDGARMLMGSGMQKQSLNLLNAEAPLVQSVSDPTTGKTVEQEMADRASYPLKAPVNGTVKKISDDFIEIDTGNGVEKVKKLNYFTTGKAGGFINHNPVVKVGDSVKQGDLLADGWQSKNGTLALGRNINVAYMPFKGYNFEDGVVVSESFCEKMASEEVKTITEEVSPDEGKVLLGAEALEKLKDLHISPGILSKLDENGVIKKGVKVSAGDILFAAVRVREKEQMTAGQKDIRKLMGKGKILTLPSDLYSNVSVKVAGYQKGKVIKVMTSPGENGAVKIVVQLLSYKPMEIGDKLSGRHGNKGTITAIFPDKEMPKTQDGNAVELIFSPLAVPSRKNTGQLMEVNAGLVAQKKGLPVWKVQNFNSDEYKRLEQDLRDIGIEDGKQVLINPDNGKPYENKITVGPMYIMKLKHKVEGKITHRNINGDFDPVLQRPRKTSGNIDGERHNPQSVGGMEFWSLTSGGAVHNIHELTTLKSDGAGDRDNRKKIFEAIRRGTAIPEPVTPQTLKSLSDQLTAASIKVTPLIDDKEVSLDEKFTELMLSPIKQKDIENLAKVPVTTAEGLKARTNTILKGSIYDPEIFGEKGEGWSRIDLVIPQPNPLFLTGSKGPKPYEAMLLSKGLKQQDIMGIAKGDSFVVLDPKDSGYKKYQKISADTMEEVFLEGKDIEADTGGSALQALLKDVDLKEELKNAEQRLRAARNLTERTNASKQVRVLGAALDNGLDAEDFMMKSLPVLPLKYRQPIKMGNGSTFAEDGLSKLYGRILKQNQNYQKSLETLGDVKEADPRTYASFNKDYLQNLEYTVGSSSKPFVDEKTDQEWKGILHKLKSKHGFLREKMQSKLQDYSGRSVITVDPTMKLDEVALPEDLAADIFQPKILNELERQRYTSKEINKIMDKRPREFRDALIKVSQDHPVILNRQPSLHNLSAQAFYPRILWNEDKDSPNKIGAKKRAIGLNPVVTTGFNADFDGDQMAVHLPITSAAIQEAKDKLLPSKNILNKTNNGIVTDLKHEMQLGIYYMTRDRMPEGHPVEFKNFKELEKAYINGDVKTYSSVRMNVPGQGMVTSTAGKHLFNLSLPRGFQNYKENVDVNKGEMKRILNDILESPMGGSIHVVNTINKLQNMGFLTATNSGVSIGIKDFNQIREINRDKLFEQAEKQLKEKYKDQLASGIIDLGEAFDQEKSEIVRKEMETIVETALDPNNPLEIMRSSGARGNAGQLTAMAGILGVGKDVTNKKTRPVNKSHIEGLSPDEFWDLTYDSRKGMYDKSIATRDPGALTREIWMHNKQTVITEKDCGDTTGVMLDMKKDFDKKMLFGRILLKDVPLEKGGVIRATGKPITKQEKDDIIARAMGPVQLRSPLTCKSTNGVCQKCYGREPGGMTNDLVAIGTPIGSIAAQALGEPSQQAVMKAFHVGAGQSNVSGAFDRIQETLRLPQNLKDPTMEAVIVKEDGTITDIIDDPVVGKTVIMGRKRYQLHHKEPMTYVKVGVALKKGDLLTKEFGKDNELLTIRNPRDVLEYQGPEIAKQYLLESLDSAYVSGGIKNTDTRHYEVVTNNLLNAAKVVDPGNSPYSVGQVVPLTTLKNYNTHAGQVVTVSMDYANRANVIGSIAADNYMAPGSLQPVVKKGEEITEAIWEKLKNKKHIKVHKKPLTFQQEMIGVENTNNMTENWLDTAAFRDATRTIREGALFGMRDKLDTPLTQQMTGKKGNFSDAFKPTPPQPSLTDFVRGFL